MTHKLLSDIFEPELYKLDLKNYPEIVLTIKGRKIGRPAKRLTFHQQDLKIVSAKISGKRRNISYEYEVARINYLKSRQEVRLHTQDILYPGEYEVRLVFLPRQPLEAYQKLTKNNNWRAYFPSIDEQEARDKSVFTLSYTDETRAGKI